MLILLFAFWLGNPAFAEDVFWPIRSARGELYLVHGTESRKVPQECAELLAKGGDAGPFKPVLLQTDLPTNEQNTELWKRVRVEQRLRFAGVSAREQDLLNLPYIKKTFYDGKFPLISTHGYAAARHAWILVQHADSDVAFQKEVLIFMLSHHGRGDVRPSDVAYLTDRVWVNQAKAKGLEPVQLFGTQGFTNAKGELELYRIVDAKRVDERRRAHGMDTLADSMKRF